MISLDKIYSSPPKEEITALLTEAKTLKIILLKFNKINVISQQKMDGETEIKINKTNSFKKKIQKSKYIFDFSRPS